MSNPKQQNRIELTTGIYIRGTAPHTTLELDMPELLEHLELEDNNENRETLMQLGQQVCRAAGFKCEQTIIGHSHKHNCAGSHPSAYTWRHEGKRKDCKLPRNSFCPACSS